MSLAQLVNYFVEDNFTSELNFFGAFYFKQLFDRPRRCFELLDSPAYSTAITPHLSG